MTISTWVQRPVGWAKKRPRTWLAIGLVASVLLISPVLFPGGFGLQSEKVSATRTVRLPDGGITVETTVTRTPEKTVWDWLDLLGVPVSLALLGAWFQYSQQQRAAAVEALQLEKARTAAQEEALQVYIDRIAVLLVDKKLISIVENDEAFAEEKIVLESALSVIRARTLSILQRFETDRARKLSVVQFLENSEIIYKLGLDLKGADLSYIDFSKSLLAGAYLSSANLQYADFGKACLEGAHLTSADLRNANLNGAYLNRANLVKASLAGADLRSAYLKDADLCDVEFDECTLWPSKEQMAKAKNLPEAARQQVGL